MSNTLAQVELFAATHPHPHQGGTWNQLCEQFINNSGGFSEGFPTAEAAAKSSGGLDRNPDTAVPGEIHYWSDYAGQGHDAWQTERGLLCASNAIPGYLGYISFAAFSKAKPAFHYMGHTFRHGTQTLNFTSTAGTGNVTPVTDPLLGDDMKLITHPNGQPAMTDGVFVFLPIAAVTMTDLEAQYGPHIPVSASAWQFTSDRVTEHRAWLNGVGSGGGSVNLQPVLDAIAAIPKPVTEIDVPGISIPAFKATVK